MNEQNLEIEQNLEMFVPLEEKYISVRIMGNVILYVTLMGLALLLLLTDIYWLVAAVESAIALMAAIMLSIQKKACQRKGYALGMDDITYRSGIIYPKVTTIPYSRIQQVSIRQNPVSRHYHLYAVEIVNGAQQMSSLTIPGLSEETANRIKSIVTDKLREAHD